MNLFTKTKVSLLFGILFLFINPSHASNQGISVQSEVTPPKFIPLAINIEFLHAMRMAATENVLKGEMGVFSISGDIEKEYLKGHKHVVVHVKNDDFYRGTLVCVSKFGVYVYDNSVGLVYMSYESIDWIRRGRSYGNFLWKAGVIMGTFFAYRNNEQSVDAIADGYIMGGVSAVTFTQILMAPIYTIRLNNKNIKFPVNYTLATGLEYYKMVVSNSDIYSNKVDIKSFTGFEPSEVQ
jgi:small nuclear ribonucleoprotein (snRNP)-like protein